MLKHLLHVLGSNNRLLVLMDIAHLFKEYKDNHEKTIDIRVNCAMELSKDQQSKLTKALKERLQRKVALQYELDDSLIGGAIIRAGDIVIDGSLLGKLNRLHANLKTRSLGEIIT